MKFPKTSIFAIALATLAACDGGKDEKAVVLQGPFVSQPPTNSPVAPEGGGTLVIPKHGPARVCPREGC